MKNILNLFSNSNMCLVHKLIACVVFACIMLGSIEFIPAKYDFSFIKNISVSADTAVNHFFSLATTTMTIISKLFIQIEQNNIDEASGLGQAKKENKTKQEKTSTEASSFSVLPTDVSFNFVPSKNIGKVKCVNDISVIKSSVYNVLFKDFSKICKEFLLLNIMLFILMMFLIKNGPTFFCIERLLGTISSKLAAI